MVVYRIRSNQDGSYFKKYDMTENTGMFYLTEEAAKRALAQLNVPDPKYRGWGPQPDDYSIVECYLTEADDYW